jgi:hypothetical protein
MSLAVPEDRHPQPLIPLTTRLKCSQMLYSLTVIDQNTRVPHKQSHTYSALTVLTFLNRSPLRSPRRPRIRFSASYACFSKIHPDHCQYLLLMHVSKIHPDHCQELLLMHVSLCGARTSPLEVC